MPKTCPLYSSEFRRQMVELVRAGRDPEDPARAFDLTAPSIRAWVARADRAEGRREEARSVAPRNALRDGSLRDSATEREELARPRRENEQPRLERDILSRAAAWFARGTGAVPSGISGS